MPFTSLPFVAGAVLGIALTCTADGPAPAGKSPLWPDSKSPPEATLPVGRWSVAFANAVAETCAIGTDGTALVSEPRRASRGQVTAMGSAVVIVFEDDRVERWTPVGRRMIVEHWYPGANFPSGAAVLGIADKGDEPSPIAWGPVTRGLQMSIRLERTRYGGGEPILLEVVIRNTANAEADLGMSACDLSSFDFAVRYVGGGMSQAGRMPFTRYGAKLLEDLGASKNMLIRLKAGEQRRYRFALNRMVDMTLSGTYSVAVNRHVPGRPRHDRAGHPLPPGPDKPAELVSNELTVEVAEPSVSSR